MGASRTALCGIVGGASLILATAFCATARADNSVPLDPKSTAHRKKQWRCPPPAPVTMPETPVPTKLNVPREEWTKHLSPHPSVCDDCEEDGGFLGDLPRPSPWPSTWRSVADIVRTMRAMRPNVDCCYAAYHVYGRVSIAVAIAPDGTVRRTQVLESFAQTPTGDCVSGALKSMRFAPDSRAVDQVEIIPFLLRAGR